METKGSLPCSQRPSLDRMVNQLEAVHTLAPYFLKIKSNIKAYLPI
jgi:hypothetical protein